MANQFKLDIKDNFSLFEAEFINKNQEEANSKEKLKMKFLVESFDNNEFEVYEVLDDEFSTKLISNIEANEKDELNAKLIALVEDYASKIFHKELKVIVLTRFFK